MRKITLLLALLACFGTSLSAQSFGLRVGVNATGASFDNDDNEIDVDGQTNLMLGIFLNLPIGTDVFTIQPELNYLNRGYSYDDDFSVAGQSFSRDYTLSYVDLGVLARLNFGSDEGLGFYIGAGPQFSYAVSGSVTETTIAGDTDRDVDFDSDRLNRSELQFSGIAGVTFDLGIKLFGEARYNGSFSNQSDLDDTDIRQRSVGLNVGIMVPLGD